MKKLPLIFIITLLSACTATTTSTVNSQQCRDNTIPDNYAIMGFKPGQTLHFPHCTKDNVNLVKCIGPSIGGSQIMIPEHEYTLPFKSFIMYWPSKGNVSFDFLKKNDFDLILKFLTNKYGMTPTTRTAETRPNVTFYDFELSCMTVIYSHNSKEKDQDFIVLTLDKIKH